MLDEKSMETYSNNHLNKFQFCSWYLGWILELKSEKKSKILL